MSEQDPDLDQRIILSLSQQDKKLIQVIREMNSGELKITVAKGVPVCAEEIKRNVAL
jgi:hypothetical protein